MARTAAEQDLDTFMSMINQNCAAKLAELDREAFVAKCLPPDDAVARSIAERRRRLIDLPATIQPGTRAELAAAATSRRLSTRAAAGGEASEEKER